MPLPGGTMDVAGIAADGFDSARAGDVSVSISNNVYSIRGAPMAPVLFVSGPAGEQSVQLGGAPSLSK
jgi:hypothetical protein